MKINVICTVREQFDIICLTETLVDMTESFGMHQLIHEATHYTSASANILDLIFTDSMLQMWEPFPQLEHQNTQ